MSTALARDDFHLPGPGPYALTHSVGCLPRTAPARLQAHFLEPWQARGGDAWGEWLAEIDGFRAALAALLGGEAGQYCPQANLSSGLAKLLGALPRPDARRRVWLASEDAFPSLGFVLQQAQRDGFDLQLIRRGKDPADPATWAERIDADTFGVLVTHVHSNTGVVAPVAEVARLCAQRGAHCVVDVAQSAGILPLDVAALGASVVLGSCIKWLCGGPGAGFLWFDPGWARRSSRATSAGSRTPIRSSSTSTPWKPAPDARRFWGGTPAVAPFVIAAEGLRRLQATVPTRCCGTTVGCARPSSTTCRRSGVTRVAAAGTGGTLCLPLGASFDAVTRALAADAVRFDSRGAVLRLSFHLCNDLADAACIARAWRSC